jgi:hypothetical protein
MCCRRIKAGCKPKEGKAACEVDATEETYNEPLHTDLVTCVDI